MIGFYLLIIGLLIIFLTTPNARKKSRRLYNDFLAFYNSTSIQIVQTFNGLFKEQMEYIEEGSEAHPSLIKSIAGDTSLEHESFNVNEDVIHKSSSSVGSTLTANTSSSSGITHEHANASSLTQHVCDPLLDLSRKTLVEPVTEGFAIPMTNRYDENRSHGYSAGNDDKVVSPEAIEKIFTNPTTKEEANDTSGKHTLDSVEVADISRAVNTNLHHESSRDDLFNSADMRAKEDMTSNFEEIQNEISSQHVSIGTPESAEGDIREINTSEEEAIHNRKETMLIHDDDLQENCGLAGENIGEVIDIKHEDEAIDLEKLSFGLDLVIPSWPHKYIYAKSDLDRASTEQKDFYQTFKKGFDQGICIDTLGNSNYYFILLFDLLEDYENHRDLTLLEKLIERLSNAYPRTRGYARTFLLEKMRQAAYTVGITRLERRTMEERTYMSWDWRSQYKDKLELSKVDLEILERINLPSNPFVSNAFCATELVKLYLRSIKLLDKAYKSKSLQKDKEFEVVLHLIATNEYRYPVGSPNYNYQLKDGSSSIYGYILKYCEQVLRSHYHFKKLPGFEQQYTHVMVNEAMSTHVIIHIEELIPALLTEIAPLDEHTEKALYTLHPTRWKSMLVLDQKYFQEIGSEKFLEYAERIIALNNSNSSLENIYLELSRFLVTLDNQKSLEYFLRYTAQNVLERKYVIKDMSKTMFRKLFKDSKSHSRFLDIFIKVIRREITIQDALRGIEGFYEPIRKRIKLDEKAIEKVQADFSGTVSLLGEFLSDEDPLQQIDTPAPKTPLLVNTVMDRTNTETSIKYKIQMSPIQAGLLDLFIKHAFSLNKAQITDYCESTGSMHKVLINNLNENCYDLIDDLLIEDDGDSYNINENYYAQIKNI